MVSVIVSPSAPNELHNMCNVVSGVVARHEAIQGSKPGTLDCRASLATTDGETMTEADNIRCTLLREIGVVGVGWVER